MADSDSDYVASGDERKSKGDKNARSGARERKVERWEEIQRHWDVDLDLEDDNIESTVAELLEAGKKRRLLKDETPLQRGIIRNLVLILDLSAAMAEKDLRPTRFILTLRYAVDFVREYFEQNPISQLCVLAMHDGLAKRISDVSGNPHSHIEAISGLRFSHEPAGVASLQNALEMARANLFHTPKHGTREIVLVYGAISSADPGDIHQTIDALVREEIRVSVVGLSAQVAICEELVRKTNSGDVTAYGVALNEQHYRELLIDATTPPVTRKKQTAARNALLTMGFPSRIVERAPSLCACHSTPSRGGYLCSRCDTKVCSLPVECPSCNLTLILSTHLARSYHHLFPLKNFREVSWGEAEASTHCFACQTEFPKIPDKGPDGGELDRETKKTAAGTSVSSRYRCPECRRDFCIDCDVFAHEILYNCPACQSLPPGEKRKHKKKLAGRKLENGENGGAVGDGDKMQVDSGAVDTSRPSGQNGAAAEPMVID